MTDPDPDPTHGPPSPSPDARREDQSEGDDGLQGDASGLAEPPPDDDGDELPLTAAVMARVAGEQLGRLGGLAQVGLILLGGLLALNLSGPPGQARGAFTLVLALALTGLGALVVGQGLRGFGALLHTLADQAEATGRMEQRLAKGLERLTALLEANGAPRPNAGSAAGSARKAEVLAELRRAIKGGRWDEADDLVRGLAAGHPGDPEAARASEELLAARNEASRELLAKIESAREVNDPDRVIELRDAIRPLLDPDALRALDRDLARWFLMLIHRRLRAGTVRADVAVLAGRVAESLDDTPEGASLRAALPTLRRAAGLCARCAQPYTDVADACPKCLASARAPATTPFTPAPEPADDPDEPPDDPDRDPGPDDDPDILRAGFSG